MAFEFTEEMAVISNNLWAIPSAVGGGLCGLVLIIILSVLLHRKARSHLDRVSFRIVIYALAANMVFGIASAVGGTRTGPSPICGLSIWLLQLTLQFSSFLFFCIALNLQLVVIHRINGQYMEKWYLIVSAVLSVILTVPPLRRKPIRMTTQMSWTALSVAGEVICSVAVLVYMNRHNGRHRRMFAAVRSVSDNTTAAPQVLHANRYKRIVFRVALYPIVSCFVNFLSIVTALHTTFSNGINDETDYNILLLSDFLYGGRAIAYALLALTDPALIRGLKALYSHTVYGHDWGKNSGTESTQSTAPSFHKPKPTQVFVELSTFCAPDDVSQNPGHETSKEASDDMDQQKLSDRKSPSNIDTALSEPTKMNDSTVNFSGDAEDHPTSPGTDMQRRRQKEDEKRDREERDAFKKQI
ncbi:hypothetical protein ONZ45_g11232 [Pleurotus djamor]|nr:hypothetical protein ONZ45_g11232 [Pleurotus djamor]